MVPYPDMPAPADEYLALVLDADLRLLGILAQRGALERQPDPADRRVKALALTPEGEHLRDQFWRNLVTDPGPLTPLREPELRALTRLLARLDQPAG
jgi:DNA-binding MarR family transcriptional regulator